MGYTYTFMYVWLCTWCSPAMQLLISVSVFHKCENTEFTQVKNVATSTSFIPRGLYLTLWEGERGIPTFLILYRERERGRGGVRGRGRGRGRGEKGGGGRVYTWCVVYVAMVPVRPSTLGVYVHMLKSHIRTSAFIHVWLCTWHSP